MEAEPRAVPGRRADVIERPTPAEAEAAAGGLRDIVVHTPLVPLRGDARSERIWLKPEIHQVVGSFKIRGVYHAVASLAPEERAAGLATVSAGNTAQALAWCGRHFGVPARSLMPDGAPATKIAAVEALGGTVELVPVDELFRYLREHSWEQEPEAFIHPWIDRRVMIGHGTLALEILADRPDVDSVFVPVGGGGLIGGVGSVLKARRPELRVYAVEPADCAALAAALAGGAPVNIECSTMCDGVAVPYITEETFPLLRDIVDEVVQVSEDDVRTTIRDLARDHKMIVEGSGALAVAAARAVPVAERGGAVSLVTGGSIDPVKFSAIFAGNPRS